MSEEVIQKERNSITNNKTNIIKSESNSAYFAPPIKEEIIQFLIGASRPTLLLAFGLFCCCFNFALLLHFT